MQAQKLFPTLSAVLLSSVLPTTAAAAANIVLSNDDGWAEKNIRVFYDALTNAGANVVLSAPADNKSGTGSMDLPPVLVVAGCEFDSCPPGSPPVGANASMPRFNYVNSFPVTSMRYGIQTLAPQFFGGPPGLALAGFNVGLNTGATVLISGTVGAATEASKEGIPALAFSGATGSQVAWDTPAEPYHAVYAALATQVTQTLLLASPPDDAEALLPPGTWLNVNMGESTATSCTSAADFTFVLSRIFAATIFTPDDVVTCGSARLPDESSLVDTEGGCYVSISVGLATTKLDAGAAEQAVVLSRLASILSCLPSSSST